MYAIRTNAYVCPNLAPTPVNALRDLPVTTASASIATAPAMPTAKGTLMVRSATAASATAMKHRPELACHARAMPIAMPCPIPTAGRANALPDALHLWQVATAPNAPLTDCQPVAA